MAYALAGNDATVHVDGPTVVAPRRNIAPVDAGAQRLELVPREVEGLVGLGGGECVGDDDVPLRLEMIEALL